MRLQSLDPRDFMFSLTGEIVITLIYNSLVNLCASPGKFSIQVEVFFKANSQPHNVSDRELDDPRQAGKSPSDVVTIASAM